MAELVLCRERFPGPDFARLEAACDVRVVGAPLRPLLLAGGEAPDAIFTAGEVVDEQLLAAVPSLRAVANMGVGTDKLDLAALERRGVALVTTAGANVDAVADHAFALLLALRHRLLECDGYVRRGDWERPDRPEPVGEDVFGSTLGIVGYGRIGRAMARRARGFGMSVLVCSRRPSGDPEVEDVALGDLLRRADAVSLHCPLTPETDGLIGRRELALLHEGAVLVNVARGRVCDQAALVDALVSGRLAGAGLDVFADEPRVPAALLDLPNVVLTPHTADLTRGTQEAMTRACVERLLGALGIRS